MSAFPIGPEKETQLLRQWRERQSTTGRPDPRSEAKTAPAAKASTAAAPAPKATVNPRRDKIVQALRSRKGSK